MNINNIIVGGFITVIFFILACTYITNMNIDQKFEATIVCMGKLHKCDK